MDHKVESWLQINFGYYLLCYCLNIQLCSSLLFYKQYGSRWHAAWELIVFVSQPNCYNLNGKDILKIVTMSIIGVCYTKNITTILHNLTLNAAISIIESLETIFFFYFWMKSHTWMNVIRRVTLVSNFFFIKKKKRGAK